MDWPVLPQPYQGSPIGDIQREGGLVDTWVGSEAVGVWKVPTGCSLWEGKGMTVLEGGRILARGTRFYTVNSLVTHTPQFLLWGMGFEGVWGTWEISGRGSIKWFMTEIVGQFSIFHTLCLHHSGCPSEQVQHHFQLVYKWIIDGPNIFLQCQYHLNVCFAICRAWFSRCHLILQVVIIPHKISSIF